MISQLWKVKNAPTFRQFVKFGLVGLVNTAAHTTVYLLMSRVFSLPPLGANAFAFLVAVTVSFTFNRRWTFRSQDAKVQKQYTKFFMVSLAGFGWSELLLYFFHHQLGWHDLVALGASIVIVLFWNFTLNKFWTFRGVHSPLVEPR